MLTTVLSARSLSIPTFCSGFARILLERTPTYRFRRPSPVRVCFLPLIMTGTSGLPFIIKTSKAARHSRNSSARASTVRTRVAPRDRRQEMAFHHPDGDAIITLSQATSPRSLQPRVPQRAAQFRQGFRSWDRRGRREENQENVVRSQRLGSR